VQHLTVGTTSHCIAVMQRLLLLNHKITRFSCQTVNVCVSIGGSCFYCRFIPLLVSWQGRQRSTYTVARFRGLMRFKLVYLIQIMLILDF
jgi:hypothetical protein